MKEIKGNLWDFHDQGYFVCITTNGEINSKTPPELIMGKGIARVSGQMRIRVNCRSCKVGYRVNLKDLFFKSKYQQVS